mmetsp:Transcript_21650/g.34834  ORF Transcript_21650/g.34834 Transcript_21650/m.34834 type:complete len:309 (+) Transcript_21650:308-1234(+)
MILQIRFQVDCTLNIGTRFIIVQLAVVNHEHQICVQHALALVVITSAYALVNRRQVNRLLDDFQVILDFVRIHGFSERPRELLFFHFANNAQQFTLQCIFGTIQVFSLPRCCQKIRHCPSSFDHTRYGQGSRGGFIGSRDALQVRTPVLGQRIVYLCGLSFEADATQNELSLGCQHFWNSSKVNRWVNITLHHCSTIVILNKSLITSLGHGNALGKTLLLEISNRIIVGIRYKVFNACSSSLLFDQIHKLCSVSLDLMRRVDGTKGNFRKSHIIKGSITNGSNDFFISILGSRIIVQDGQRSMATVKD